MNTQGTLLHEFAIATPGSQAWDMTVGPDQNLWFTEYFGNNVGRISMTGALQEFPVADGGPTGIILGPGSNLWLTENLGNKIDRMTTKGTITQFAVPPPGANPLEICTGPDGNLWYVLQSSASEIGRVTPSGVFTQFPIASARDITLGSDGNLWFTDPADNQIVRLEITP